MEPNGFFDVSREKNRSNSKFENFRPGEGGRIRWPDGRKRPDRPIDLELHSLLELLDRNRLVIVQAETGAGKTSRIPQAVALAYPGQQVIVTQPRRAAVRWNADYVAREMGSPLGGKVGYRLSRETPRTSNDTQVSFHIDQSIINSIRRTGRLPEGILIIDEAHERSVSLDLLLGLIKEYLPQSPNTRVLITSATIDAEKFSTFFGGAPNMRVSGRMFPVDTEVIRLERYEHHSQGAARAAKTLLERFVKQQLLLPPDQEGGAKSIVQKGTVLVLLPGKEDIGEVMANIAREAERLGVLDRIEILSCHGESSPKDQDAVQMPVPERTLRIICGTEILRTSVTVPETIAVVDSLQVKRFITDNRGIGHLVKVPVSREQADQAKGRAGRTQPGIYIPVSFDNEYEKLQPFTQPAILREPVTHTALQVAAIGRSLRTFPLIDAPASEKVEVAIRRLQRMGALDENERITEIGEQLAELPIEPELGRTLAMAEKLGVLPEAVILVSALESEGFFHLPRGDSREIHEQRQKALAWRAELAGESKSDFTALVKAYRAYKAKERELRYDKNGMSRHERENELFAWCSAHGLNLKRLRATDDMIRELMNVLSDSSLAFRWSAEERDFDAEALTKALATGLVDNVGRQDRSRRYNTYTSIVTSGFDITRHSLCPNTVPFVLVHGFTKIPVPSRVKRSGGDTEIILALHAAPLKSEWLKEIMPQLCHSRRLDGTLTYNWNKDRAEETEAHYYGDLEIGREQKDISSENPLKASTVLASELAKHSGWWEYADNRIGGVMDKNVKRQRLAKDLNNRLGERRFKVFSQDELTEHYLRALAGASRIADIKDVQALQLPALDDAEIERTLAGAPNEIQVIGSTFPVSYHENGPPTIQMSPSMLESGVWKNIPDHVYLPSGREVEIIVQWGRFIGQSVSWTGEAVKKEFEFRELEREAETLLRRLKELREIHRIPYKREGWVDRLEPSVRAALFDEHMSFIPSGQASLPSWMERTKTLIAEVERSAAEYEGREAMLKAAEERGEILRNFSAFVHTSGARGDGGGYVIRPDGSLREPDRHEYERSHGRGRHDVVWDIVLPEECALEWRGWRETAEEYAIVRKAPVTYTEAQLATMRRLANKHGVSSWEGEPHWQQKGASGRVPEKSPDNTVAKDSGVDPNSPFAKLMELKKKLEEGK